MAKWGKGGASPNPGGRPKESKLIAELARSHCPRMIQLLVEIAEDPGAGSSRVAAINAILDRGLGKAPQEVNLTADVELNLSDLTDEQLINGIIGESIKAFQAGEMDSESFLLLMKLGPEIDDPAKLEAPTN